MFLPLLVWRCNTALLKMILTHCSLVCHLVFTPVLALKRSANVNMFFFNLRGRCDPGAGFKAQRHMGLLKGNGGTEERNAEWAKEQLQKCLNAYSELPTTHVNQSSHRLPLFPISLSPSSISLYLPFLSYLTESDIWGSEQDDQLVEKKNSKKKKKKKSGLRGTRSLVLRLV